MSLERKDVRCKLDPEIHGAYSAIADLEGGIAELTEKLIVEYVTRRIHDAKVIMGAVERAGISGKNGD